MRVRQFAGERKMMNANFEETLISVWRQALVEDCKTVTLEGVRYPVRPTRRSKLREVDFRFEEQTLRERYLNHILSTSADRVKLGE
jgi:hypothetical protein